MPKDPPPIGTIENIAMVPKIAGEDAIRPHTRFDLDAKLQSGDDKNITSLTPVSKQKPRIAVKEVSRSYDAPASLSRELSLVKGSIDKITGRFVSFLKSYNPNLSYNAFEVSAFFSAFMIFVFKDTVDEENRRFMLKYIDVLLEKVEDKDFEALVLKFSKFLEERQNASCE
jgi:hypothetical protein